MKIRESLIDGYFYLRQGTSLLRQQTDRFEGKEWKLRDHMMIRKSDDGYELRVYEIEGDIEVCIIAPNGGTKTFAQAKDD